MKVTELREELDKLIAAGHGDKQCVVMNSPDDGMSGEWEPLSDVSLARNGEVLLL